MIGKATVGLVVLLLLLMVIAFRVPSEWAMLAIAMWAPLVFLGYLYFLGHIARNHPDLAATEGPTYVQTRQIDLAAKGMSGEPPTPIIPDPQNPTLLPDMTKEKPAETSDETDE